MQCSKLGCLYEDISIFSPGEMEETTRTPWYTWMKTIQQDMKSNNLSLNAVRGRPGGLLQFSEGKAVKIFLASVSSDNHAVWLNSGTVVGVEMP